MATESSEINKKTDDDVVKRHREIKVETPSLNPSVEDVDDELAYQRLSRSQTHWLSIGEKIGAWIVKIKTKP